MWDRLKLFLNPFDRRYEDMLNNRWYLVVMRDFSAGLIVAMMAIPLAMGFAMASGLKPEQGIVGGAIAGLVGALFGGSKYQVYGPTAAFIPVIAGLMFTFTPIYGADGAHGMLVLGAIIAGVILIVMGLTGLGKYAHIVPHSIVVGFTIGIAVTIALSQVTEVFGLEALKSAKFFDKVQYIGNNLSQIHLPTMGLAAVTFLCTHWLLKISKYLPAPLIAIGVGILLSQLLNDGRIKLIEDRYGQIPTDFLLITPPMMPEWTPQVVWALGYLVVAIVFVSGVESLLCSRMADRLADNRGTPFNPNKEFWGQGLVQIIAPLLNGFPHTGALARTATNIKVGAVTPLAGILKCVLKLGMAYYLATYLELVPMACIGGILMWVAFNMVKPAEVRQVLAHDQFHIALMIVTAVGVIVTDFLTGVLAAMALYGLTMLLWRRWGSPPGAKPEHPGHSSDVADDAAYGDTASEAPAGWANGQGAATAHVARRSIRS
jgi:MFS superfamily sulfate permease-like transporter